MMQPGSTIMAMAKGFRVTEDSEEFQLVWPPAEDDLTYDVERSLTRADWPGVLRALYKLDADHLATLRCVLLSKHWTTAVAVASSRDKYRRPSIVAVAVTEPIEWSTPTVSTVVARSQTAAHQVARELAMRFHGSPKGVAAELRQGNLPIAGAPLEPSGSEAFFWEDAIASARLWKGIAGLASPPLMALGANILIGTRHEAVRTAGVSGTVTDGFFDEVSGSITPLTDRLIRWPHSWEPEQSKAISSPKVSLETGTDDPLRGIDESLRGIDRSVKTVADATVELLQLAGHFWFGIPRRKK